MSAETLKQKAQNILNEKISKIKAENIKKNIQVFDIEGSYEGDLPVYVQNTYTKTNISCIGKSVEGTNELAGIGFIMSSIYRDIINDTGVNANILIYNNSNNTLASNDIEAKIHFFDKDGNEIYEGLDMYFSSISIGDWGETVCSLAGPQLIETANSFTIEFIEIVQ